MSVAATITRCPEPIKERVERKTLGITAKRDSPFDQENSSIVC